MHFLFVVREPISLFNGSSQLGALSGREEARAVWKPGDV
jgi:hypothetical protein